MTTIERTATVPASPDAVWAVLADFGSIAQWADNADHSCLLTEQESGVGMVRRIQAGRVTLVETVTTWQPGTELAYDIAGAPKVIRSLVNTWRLTPNDGGTQVTLVTDVDAGPRPPQKLIARIAARQLAKASDTMLAGLTAELATREQTS